MNGSRIILFYLRSKDFLKEIVYSITSKKLKKISFPEIINIETSITCNAHCITCPHKGIIREKNMKFKDLQKIIDEISNYPVKEIHPFNYGEPFLYPDFIKSLKYIRKKSKSKIFIYSNGSAMTEEQTKEIIKNRLIDRVNFSMDAATSKTYGEVRGLDYKTTVKKILNFIELNKKMGNKIEISISFVINDKNKNEISLFKKIWSGKAKIHLGIDDGRNNTPLMNRSSKIPCKSPFSRLFILTNGDVVCCEHDPKGEFILGSIHQDKIKTIWDSEKYDYIRSMHNSRKKVKISICKNCPARF